MTNIYRDASYTSEKLSNLVHHLASNEGTLPHRFRDALSYVMGRIDVKDFPLDQQEDAALALNAIKNWDSLSIHDLKFAVDKIRCLEADVLWHLEDQRIARVRKEYEA